jgi:drug/metabolite transporter (DMT)-like permease
MYELIIYIIGIFLFVINSIIIKSFDIKFMNKTLLSIISVIVPSIIYIKFNDPNYNYVLNNKKLMVSILYFIQTLILFLTYKLMPISLALPITFGSSILFIDMLNLLINNKPFGDYRKWIANLIIIFGLFIISNSKINNKYKYIGIGVILSIIWGLIDAYTMISKENKKKDEKELLKINKIIYELNIFGVIVLSFIISFVKIFNISDYYNIFDKTVHIRLIIKFLFIQLITYYIAFLCLFYGLDNINISIWGAMSSLLIIFSVILGKIFLNENIGINKIIGLIIIISGLFIKFIYQ